MEKFYFPYLYVIQNDFDKFLDQRWNFTDSLEHSLKFEYESDAQRVSKEIKENSKVSRIKVSYELDTEY